MAALAGAADGAVDVGATTVVVHDVRGALDGRDRALALSDRVFHQERILTGPDSASQITFRDDTVLTVGAESQVILDDYVYDPDPSRQRMVVNVGRGVLRFVSGTMAKQAYEVRAPGLTIGVRGTVFSLVVGDDGSSTVIVHEGEVELRGDGGGGGSVGAGQAASAAAGQSPSPAGPAPAAAQASVAGMVAAVAVAATPASVSTGSQVAALAGMKAQADEAGRAATGTGLAGAGGCGG